jgi:GntR family transcriptional repressor for pyruvate dehydrogenase complex
MFKAVNKTEKVSDNIITQIRNAILSGQIKPGDKLASEKELTVQFAVSKATMREALRVLEFMGLVEIKKGLAGGAYVAEADMKTTINSITNFLHFKSVSIRDITMVRYMMEPPVAEMAASRIQPEHIEKMKDMIGENISQKQIGFHRYLARFSQNPVHILIMDFIDNMLQDIKLKLDLGSEFYTQVAEAHQRILECLIRKDGAGARREITKDILQVGNYLAKLTGVDAFDPKTI